MKNSLAFRRGLFFALAFTALSVRPAFAIQTQEVDIGRSGVYDGVVKIERDTIGRMTLCDAEVTSPVTLNELRYHGTAHWLLQGLDHDDHPLYHTDARALTWLAGRSTSDLPEGSRLYHTDARARSAVSVLSPLAYNFSTGVFSLDPATTPTFAGIALSGFSSGAIPYFGPGGKLTSNTGRFSMSTSGRVGIGTSSPTAKLVIREGNLKFERISAPSAAPTLAAAGSGGALAAGDYRYRVTYVTASGETDLGSISNTVTCVANDSIMLSNIPIGSDPAVLSRKIYRTKLSNPGDFYLACAIADNTTTNWTDTKADSALSADRYTFAGNSTAGMIMIDSNSAMRVQAAETALGFGALPVGTGFGNAAIGNYALSQNTSGYYNSAFGENALKTNTSGNANTAVGTWAMLGGTVTGINNSALGVFALRSATTCSHNVAAGSSALSSASSGSGNIALGANALYSVTSGGGNVAIGNSAGKNAVGSNEFYVGNIEQANNANEKSCSLMYGVFSGTAGSTTGQKLAINGSVGIGTSSPAAPLDVNGAARMRGTLSIDGETSTTALNVVGRLRLAGSSAQSITTDTQTVACNAGLIVLNPNANHILTSAPTISAGVEGQVLTIVNQNANYSVRLYDADMSAGTNLALASGSRTLYKRDVLTLLYTGGMWCEVNYASNH